MDMIGDLYSASRRLEIKIEVSIILEKLAKMLLDYVAFSYTMMINVNQSQILSLKL